AVGTTTGSTARRRTATGTRRRTGTTTSVCDLPELRAVRGGVTGRNRPLSRSARALLGTDKRTVGHPAFVADAKAPGGRFFEWEACPSATPAWPRHSIWAGSAGTIWPTASTPSSLPLWSTVFNRPCDFEQSSPYRRMPGRLRRGEACLR